MNIQQLRAQIAALQDATMDENKNFRSSYDEGKFDALTAVDTLLDSMQEEHDRIVDQCIYGKEPELVDVDDLPVVVDAPPKDYVKGFADGRLYEQRQKSETSVWHDASEPPVIDKTFLLVAPNGNSSLCLWGGKQLHSVTIGGGHSVLCKGDIYSYIDDLLNLDNSCNFGKNLQEEPVSTRDKLRTLSDGKQHIGWLDDAREVEEESVSDDLGEYINELSKQFPEVSFAKLSRIAVRVSKWQKQQDQSTIELAEDHAMLSGMNIMEQQMMAKAIDAELYSDGMFVPLIGLKDKEKVSDIKFGDKVKVIIIKED